MADPVAAVGTMAEEEWGGKKWNGSKWVESNPMGGTSSGRSDPAKAGGGLSGSLLEDGGDTNAQAEDGHSEPYLLWKLALPLLVANVAEELSTIYMYIFWASLGTCTGLSDSGVDCSSEFRNHGLKAASSDCPSGCDYDDGTTQLAAANNMYSGTQFSIVVIFGAQQAVYTMAPQAAGAGANKQVGVILQMVLFWSLVVLGLPTALSWIYMGEAMDALGLIKDDCADNSTTSNSTRHSIQGSADELDLINSYGVASVFYLGPYVLMYSVMTWLESIEEVEWAEPFVSLFAGLHYCRFILTVEIDQVLKVTRVNATESCWLSVALGIGVSVHVVVGLWTQRIRLRGVKICMLEHICVRPLIGTFQSI
jgi:hypothetical protein